MQSHHFLFRTLRWSAWDGCDSGMEHVDVRPADGGLAISGVVIGREGGSRFGLTYRLRLDSLWRTRDVHLRTTSGKELHLESDGQGHWLEKGRSQPALQGCIDVDIQATPLTNTLPIRRLEWQTGSSVEVRLCYIAVPELAVSPSVQQYTALAAGSLFRFKSLESGFAADLPVDGDGFVVDYPHLFRRLP
jgi:uncharacterized protein